MSARQQKVDELLLRQKQQAAAQGDPVAGSIAPPPSLGARGGNGAVNRGGLPPEAAVEPSQPGVVGRAARDIAQGVRDLPRSVVRGVAGAANEASKNIKEVTDWVENNILGGHGSVASESFLGTRKTDAVSTFGNMTSPLKAFMQYHRRLTNPETGDLVSQESLPKKSESVTGQGIESLTQFAVGMIGASKVLKPLKATSIAGKVALSAAKSALADFAVMDPYQERLSNIVAEHSELARPVAELLSADKDDSRQVAQLKNAVEGIGLGLMTDAFVGSVKLLKNSRLLKDAPAAAKPALEAEQEALISEVEAALTRADKDTKFQVVQTPDGKWTIETNLSSRQESAVQRHANDSTAGGDQVRRASREQVGAPPVGPELTEIDNITRQQADQLIQAVAEAKPADKTLYRGITVPPDSPILKQIENKEELTFGISSFSEEEKTASFFKNNRGQNVVFTLEPGAQAFKVDPKLTNFPEELEWVSSGKFQVVDSKMINGDLHVSIKQVPSSSTTSLASTYPRTFDTQSQAISEASTLNALDKEMNRPRPTPGNLTTEQKTALLAQARNLADPDNPWMAQTGGIDFNFRNFNTDEDAKKWIEAISIVMKPELAAARGGAVLTNQQVLDRIGELFPNGDRNQILSALARKYSNIADIEAVLVAGKASMDTIGSQVAQLSKQLDGDPENMVLLSQLTEGLDALFRTASMTKGIQTTAARATQAGRITTAAAAQAMKEGGKAVAQEVPKTASQAAAQALGGQGLIAQKILSALPNLSPETIQGLARKIRLADGDPSVILDILTPISKATPEELANPKFMDYVNTVWVNSVLSGPLTTMQNLLGTASAVIQTPVEKYFTGALSRNKVIRDEASDIFSGYVGSLGDAWAAGKKAFSAGKSVLDPEHMTQEWKSPIQGYLGTAVNAPSRFLMSQDAFFKDLSYRAFVRAQGMKEARELGLTSEKAAEYAEKALKSAFNPDGSGISSGGLDFSRYVTFTNNLDEGTLGKWLQDGVGKHPAMRFAALPFVRTPTNLMLWNWERTPLIGLLARRNREALMAGGTRAAEVWAKQATGAMMWGSATALALFGMITGNGPSDPDLRKQWTDAGYQPYSVKVGDKWVSYRRGDPLLMPLGIVADMAQSSGELPWEETDSIATAFGASLARNVSSKSYMYNLTSFMNAAFRGDEKLINSFLQGKAASFVPSVANQLNPDDEMHELRGYVDTVISRIPGMSETLPARRNIFGEPVMKAPFYPNRALNPFTVSKTFVSDSADNELLEIGKAIPFPSKNYPSTSVDMASRKYGLKGDLTPYDRMLQIMASPGHGAPSLRQAIEQIVKSPEWDKMSGGVPGVQEGGTKFEVVNNVVQRYREMARKRILSEFPELRKAVQQAVVSEEAAKRGGPQALERVMKFFQEAQ